MFALDLFNNDHERRLAEGAVDQLEQRRIDDLAMKMDDLVARAKKADTTEAKQALMKEFQKCKAERDSYYKVRNETMGYGGLTGEGQTTPTATGLRHHAKPGNYGGYEPEPELKGLNKTLTKNLEKGMGVEFKKGGVGNRVQPDMDEGGIPGNVPVGKIPGKEDLLKGKGRSYYEADQKKNSEVIESHMSELDAMRQDLEHMNDRQFYTAYGISKAAFQQKYRTLLKPALDEHGGGIGPKQHWQDLMQEQRLAVGDPIVVTGPNEFEGKTGEIDEFSPSGTFVIVNLYNHGKHSMHLSDIAYNEYADQEQDEEDDWYDEMDEGFQDFNKVEPYAVCLAGKPVKRFDYYEDARRFHDNWKQKLYREGDKAKADKITLMPLNLDEAMNKNDLLGNVAKDLNTQFKKAKSGKLKASGDFTRGDHWQGAKPGDYGYTGYQGHGMPTDKAERDRIRADKKKGVAESDSGDYDYPYTMSARDKGRYDAMTGREYNNPYSAFGTEEDHNNAIEYSAAYDSSNEQGVAEGIVDTIRSKNYARLADRSADKRATALDNFDEPEHQKQTDIMKQRNLKSRLLNKKGVAEGTGPQSKLDQKIIHLLTNGIPADAIARKLDIPVAWVDEVAEYNMPDSAIDYNDPRNTPPTNRFVEGVAESATAPIIVPKRRAKAKPEPKFDIPYSADDYVPPALAMASAEALDRIIADPSTKETTRELAKKARAEKKKGVAEAIVASGPSKPLDDRAVRKLVWDTMKINADTGDQAIQRALSVLAKKPQSRMVQDLQDKFQSLADRLSQGIAEAPTDYSKRRARERDVDAGKTVAKPRQSKQTDYQKRRAQDKKDMELGEDQDTSGVESAIIRRIMVAHTDLLKQFGPEKVMQAAEEVAYNVGDVDEIGTSDVSAYVAQVKQILGVPQELDEKWSQKYKSSINCANPKGFSQKAHCAGKKK